MADPWPHGPAVIIPMAEFDQLVEPDELRYELDEGELIVMTLWASNKSRCAY